MNAARLLQHFERISEAPDAVPRLRRFILDLAVRGKLVEQDPKDEPAVELLERIRAEKARLVKEGKIRSPRALETSEEGNEPFQIPLVWTWCRLSEVGAIVGGGTAPSADADNFTSGGSGTAWLTPADLGKHIGLYVSHGARDLTPQGLLSSSATLMPKGSVLFTSRAPIGYTAIAANEVSTNQGFKSVVPFIPACNLYIAVYFRAFGKWIDGKASGTTFREVSGKIVASLPFPLPPLAEQHRIIAKIDELMTLCDRLEAAQAERENRRDRLAAASLHRLNNGADVESFREHARFYLRHLPRLTTRPKEIHQLRQTILNLAVRGKLVPQDPNDGPAPDFDGEAKLERTLPFQIPDSWGWSRLQSLGRLKGGGTPSKSEGAYWNGTIPWVSPKDMKRDYIETAQLAITQNAVAESAANIIEPKSILFVVRGMILAHSFPVAIASVALTINQDMKALVLRVTDMSEFILRALKGLKPQILSKVQRSSHGTCRIEGRDYRDLLVPVPPLLEQQRIVARVDELMSLCDKMEAGLTTTATTSRRILEATLHRAFVVRH